MFVIDCDIVFSFPPGLERPDYRSVALKGFKKRIATRFYVVKNLGTDN